MMNCYSLVYLFLQVIGMKSMNGHIAWQHLIPDLVPFTRFGKEKLLLYTQRTTAHFPHPPQCVVVGRNKVIMNWYCHEKPGLEVIKLFSCSTKLSIKFTIVQMLKCHLYVNTRS